MTRVLVTGASGFLAGHCVAELLENGYAVRGTVRNLRKADTSHLLGLAERTGGQLDFCEAELGDDSGWDAAVDGCDYVWHVAAPFPSTIPKDENEVVRPAVEGTLRVLKAAAANGVRRVVLTSSGLAVHAGHDEDRVYTEQDWADTDRAAPYAKSKALAERGAWDYARASGLELVTINPGAILGPLMRPGAGNSTEIIRRMMTGALPLVPKIGWSVVDARDLARLHRLAMETPGAAGNRYLAGDQFLWAREMATVLADRYPVRTGGMPYPLMWMISRFEPAMRLPLSMWGHRRRVSAAKAERELGWTARPPAESVLDTAASMIDLGLATPR